MATTEQRTGFRLPWASDARTAVPAEEQAPPAAGSTPDAADVTSADPSTPEATEMQEATTTPDSRAVAWPDADAGSGPARSRPSEVAIAPALMPARPRRENPLVAGLVRAMREAATTARQDAATRFQEQAKTQIEAIQAQSADEAAKLRKEADGEIVRIRDWSKAETARIREETDQRIAGRRHRLESEVEAHAAHVVHRIERVQTAIGDFERRMDTFFEELLAEEDPARLAGMAEQLPEPPSLDIDDIDVSAPVGAPEVLDADGAASAEAAAFADMDSPDLDDGEADLRATGDGDGTDGDGTDGALDVVGRLEAYSGAPASLPEHATSALAVVGLVSVASIAGFKRALAKLPGVGAVTVASGPNGDFIFSVTHDLDTDLRAAVLTLTGFSAVITGDADGVVTVTAAILVTPAESE